VVATLEGTDPDRETEGGELVDWLSSSLSGSSSDEISTLGGRTSVNPVSLAQRGSF
jgi:hypothetical protein